MDYYYTLQDEASLDPMLMPVPPLSPELPFDLIASELPALARPSAFEKYARLEFPGAPALGLGGGGGGKNIHKRMAEVLGKIGKEMEVSRGAGAGAGAGVESSRGFRHMMRERQRREKLSQSYADLYAMVSSQSKGDKNSIVQSAAMYIRELKGARDQLQRQNEELKAKILGHDLQQQCVNVKFEVDEPSSTVDSMIGALRCLKNMNVKARGIRSDLSGHTLSTAMNIETTIAASEVEKAVEAALKEAERKQQPHIPFPGSKGWSETSHVGNVF